MTPFEKLMNDIFSNKDFLQVCKINNKLYTCIKSAITDGIAFTDAGLQNTINFTLDIKLPISEDIQKGDIVIYKNKKYKVASTEEDSAGVSLRIFLQSLSQG